MRVIPLGAGLAVALAASSHAAEPKLPPVEEAASRAALQDHIGNVCPGVAPDYAMRVVLVGGFKSAAPERWAKAYLDSAREIVAMLTKPEDAEAICAQALSLYGPKGSYVPRLLKPAAP